MNNPVEIVRPPVVLVHGLWSNPGDSWINFSPTPAYAEAQLWAQLAQPIGQRVFWADYSTPVSVGSPTPSFLINISQVQGSALGFKFNAPTVLEQILKDISTYASNLSVAAVQADVIAHSMGGDIARTMAIPNEPWTFLTNGTYGQGPIEKLITIGTPHLGRPLAGDLLPNSSGDPNYCVREFLALKRTYVSLTTANVGGNSVSGAVNDLVGDGQDTSGLSKALQALQAAQSSQPFPMAYMGGYTQSPNLASLSCVGCMPFLMKLVCWPEELAADLTPTGWNSVFAQFENDGIVPLMSQINGTSLATALTFSGIIHSPGIEGIGSLNFVGPSELDPGPTGTEAVDLLNEPKTGTDYQR